MLNDILEIATRLNDCKDTFAGKIILITGGCGFLGSVFKKYFLHLGNCEVVAVDNYITSNCVEGIYRANIVEDELQVAKVDYIINAAGIASPYHYRRLPLETLDVSYIGTRRMMELAKQHHVKGFLSFSSSEVYGNPKIVPTPESYIGTIDTMGSRSSYDIGKLAIETLSYIYNTKYGVNVKIVRPFNVFGPPLLQNDYRVIPNLISRALKGEPLHIYGDGEQTRTFCYITDFIVGAIKVLLYGDNLPYNIGNNNNEIKMLELAKLIEKVMGHSLDIRLIPYPSVYPHEEPRRRCPDITKANLQIGYEPIVNIRDGIDRFYQWAKLTE
jgi:UDP-glucuronate decarboxylase